MSMCFASVQYTYYVLLCHVYLLSPGSSFPEDGSEESSGECGNSEFYESEFWESETGEGWESESKTSDVGSLYIPTPERPSVMASPIDLPNVLGFIELPQLGKFFNNIRSCTTPGCKLLLV